MPCVVGIGFVASLAEGIGISLFIPLIDSAMTTDALGPEAAWWAQTFNRVFSGVEGNQRLLLISLCLGAAILIKVLLTYAASALNAWVEVLASRRLQTRILRQLHKVSFRFIEKSRSGQLLNAIATQSWRTSEALCLILQAIVTTCSVLVYISLLLLLSVKLTLFVAVFVTANSLIVRWVTRRASDLGQEVTRSSEGLAERMVESLGGLEVTRVFGAEQQEQARFEAQAKKAGSALLRCTLTGAVVSPLHEFLSAIVLLVVFAVTVSSGQGIPVLLAFIFVLFRLQPRVRALDEARTRLRSLAASVDRVFDLLDDSDKPFTRDGSVPFSKLEQGIRIEGVTFSYESGQPALQDVTATIPAGKMTAIVGPSGAGKSTLVKLLLRLYEPDQGSILADNEQLNHLKLSTWYGHIGVVSQRLYLFNDTVRANIAFGSPAASPEDVIQAARLAGAHDFIERLPQGYETEVGDIGVRLSGGQQQRIALARAFVRKPQILILDEATNALDAVTESVIKETFANRSSTQTLIVIAHRASTIEQADHILVLENGQLRESGSHQELARREGFFALMQELDPVPELQDAPAIPDAE